MIIAATVVLGAVALTAVLAGPAVLDAGYSFALLPVALNSAMMVLAAVTLVLNVVAALVKVVSSGGKLYAVSSPIFWYMIIMNCIIYFTNRLMYTMCLNSV